MDKYAKVLFAGLFVVLAFLLYPESTFASSFNDNLDGNWSYLGGSGCFNESSPYAHVPQNWNIGTLDSKRCTQQETGTYISDPNSIKFTVRTGQGYDWSAANIYRRVNAVAGATYTFSGQCNHYGDNGAGGIGFRSCNSPTSCSEISWRQAFVDKPPNVWYSCNPEPPNGSVFIAPAGTQYVDLFLAGGENVFWRDGTQTDFYFDNINLSETLPVVPTITGNINGPNSGTVGQALSYTGNGFGTGVNKVELYYSPASSQSWSLIKSCAATTCTGSWTPAAIGTYYVVVNAYNTTLGAQCSGNPWLPLPPGWNDCGPNDRITLTVNPAPPPAIDSLYIMNQGNHDFPSNVMGTGRMGTENGHDWFNPVNITLNTSQGGYPRKNYYAALYQRSQGAFANAATFLSDIKGYLDIYTLSAGVLLAYGQLNGDISNNTYVWTGSVWQNISGYPLGYPVCGIEGCTPTQTYYLVFPINSTPTWKVLFYKNFLSGNLYTAVYAEDNQVPPNAAFNADIAPWLFR